MEQALEIRILIVLHFGDWENDGVGMGHLSPTEASQFIGFAAMRPVKYKNIFWNLSHTNMEIDSGVSIMRLYFNIMPRFHAGLVEQKSADEED